MRKKEIQEKYTEQNSLLFLLTPSSSPLAAQNLSPFTLTETNMNPHPPQAVLALAPYNLAGQAPPFYPRDGNSWESSWH